MKQQLHIFFTALMFLTRIPVPRWVHHSHHALQQSARYFSLVGLLVGSIGAITWLLALEWFSIPTAIVLSMLATLLTTGAFHEDGFADCCDAFGGGWTKEKILTIMKDSRLGTFGVAGLFFILALKGLLLFELSVRFSPQMLALLLITAHAISRFMPVTIMQQYPYVQDIDASKSKPLADRKLTVPELLTCALFGLMGFAWLPLYCLWALPLMLVARWYAGRYFYKWIGGYTGDCLGATQQVTEICFYAGILIASRYI
jgi:adenosylcobinamide-GDP ribazoletransferase